VRPRTLRDALQGAEHGVTVAQLAVQPLQLELRPLALAQASAIQSSTTKVTIGPRIA
jgi:hypothetical protein